MKKQKLNKHSRLIQKDERNYANSTGCNNYSSINFSRNINSNVKWK